MSAGRKNTSIKKDWNTPPKYVQAVLDVFGNVDLDPCSNHFSLMPAVNKFTLPVNGLEQSWNYPKIYVNPPYGRDSQNGTSLYDWIEKGVFTHDQFDSELIYLIPVATNTRHFKQFIFKRFTCICFLEDTRLKFYNEGKEDAKGAPMACCMCYIGRRHINKFIEIFSQYGKCLLLEQPLV